MNNPAYSESFPSAPKRRRPSKLENLTIKKQRIPETSTKELADSIGDRRVIGESLLLQDGVGINWGRYPPQRPTPGPIQSFFEAENSAISINETGYHSFNPIIIDDEFPSLEAQENNLVKASTNGSEENPSRSGGTKKIATDEGVLGADIIEINPTDSDESDHEEYLVSLLDQEFPEGLDEGRLINLVVFKNLPTDITSRDITRLLNDSGFILSVDEIVQFRHGTISVKFTHAHIADAAFSVIHNKALPFPWRDHLGPLAVVRWVINDGGGLSGSHGPPGPQGDRIELDAPFDLPKVVESPHMSLEVPHENETHSNYPAMEKQGPLSTHLVSVDSETFNSNSDGTLTEEGTDSESESGFDGGNDYPSALGIISNNRVTYKVRCPSLFLFPDFRSINQVLEQVQSPTSRTSIHNLVSSLPKDPASQQFSGDPSGRAQHRSAFRQVLGTHGLGVNPCRLPVTPFNRPRRVLIPSHPDLPLVTVSMRADIQFISRETRTGNEFLHTLCPANMTTLDV
ncbi:hypothetical protein BDZ94DRAFT_1232037 [Collybia nuda]|uniref:RRM domain-containing protein n=1 Tax=Collybia nuda TaxID=64659 RepID=A0A9P6CQX3_9AGAR|nr:hypothetical protein BDZ94DRAFT_1232037 [Collybia nuda]